MDQMDWLARNAEFLSPEAISKCLIGFKELYNFEVPEQRNAYVKAKHRSNAIMTVSNLMRHTAGLQSDEETNSRLAILLSIYEPLLINDQNLETALKPVLQIIELLIDIIVLPDILKQQAFELEVDEEEKVKVPIYLKYGIRCMTSCMRSNQGLLRLVSYQNGAGLRSIIDFLEFTTDEEVQANCAKIIRICLRDELVS